MIRIIKQELNISPILKKKINWASKYTNINITIENGALIRLEPTNIAYIEPHKVIINENTFMFFNEKDKYYDFSVDLYTHGIINDKEIKDIKDNYDYSKEKESKNKNDDFELQDEKNTNLYGKILNRKQLIERILCNEK